VGYARTSGSDFYDTPAQVSGFSGFGWGVTVAQPESLALQVLAQLIETGRELKIAGTAGQFVWGGNAAGGRIKSDGAIGGFWRH